MTAGELESNLNAKLQELAQDERGIKVRNVQLHIASEAREVSSPAVSIPSWATAGITYRIKKAAG
jgi:hypothetical protein